MREHFLPYDLREFTDTNSVICKIIVGADAHIRPRVDVGIDPYEMSVKEKDIESNSGVKFTPLLLRVYVCQVRISMA